MTKISNEILAEKIDNLTNSFNDFKKEKCPEIQANTEFRLKAKGVMATIGLGMGIITLVIGRVIDKIFK